MHPSCINPNVQTFAHCPHCGRKGLTPESAKSFLCPFCGFGFFINCAAAAMALILDRDQQLLVTTRKFDPGKGSLDLPGGFAEPGESIEEALAREIEEELGLKVEQMDYFCSFANTYPFGRVIYPVTDMAFICQVAGLSTLVPGDDVSDVCFIPVPDLDPDLFSMTSARKTVARFKDLFPKITPSHRQKM